MMYGNYCHIFIENFPQKFSPCKKTGRPILGHFDSKIARYTDIPVFLVLKNSNKLARNAFEIAVLWH